MHTLVRPRIGNWSWKGTRDAYWRDLELEIGPWKGSVMPVCEKVVLPAWGCTPQRRGPAMPVGHTVKPNWLHFKFHNLIFVG